MYEIHANVGRGRIYITLKGKVGPEEEQAALAALLVELARFRSRFDVITDISELEPLCEAAIDCARIGGKALATHGARKIVHVVGRSAQAAIQFEHYARETGYSAHLAFTLKEAEAMFDGDLA